MNNNFAAILPGSRVRNAEGVVGTVERLESRAADRTDQPDYMVVRDDSGQQRYHIPLLLVDRVSQETFNSVVHVGLATNELTNYIAEPNAPQLEEGTDRPNSTMFAGEHLDDDAETLRIPLAVEELTAVKQPVVLGTVHIHKGVETLEQRLNVPVYHEEAIVEHIAPDQYDGSVPENPNEIIIPIVEEQLVVEKRTVVKEYIRVRKNRLTENRDVSESVRREYVDVSEQRHEEAGTAALLEGPDTAQQPGDTQS